MLRLFSNLLLQVLRFTFWGSGATNYGNELLEHAVLFIHVYPKRLREALLDNWLVNPSGEPHRWHELDLLQEHLNFWIKVFFNSRNSDFGSSFLQKAVSLNIPGFSQFRAHLEEAMGITPVSGYHFKPSVRNDIIALANRHNMDDIFTFHPGHTQSFQVKDVLAIGIEKLGQTNLITDFLTRTGEMGTSLHSDLTDGDEEGVSDDRMDELDELDDDALDEFEGPNDLLR